MNFDLTTWTGIAAVVTTIIGGLKKFVPWVSGKEALVALVLGLGLAAVAKVSGLGWSELTWVQLVVAGLSSGVGAGLIHDKVVNPVRGKETDGVG